MQEISTETLKLMKNFQKDEATASIVYEHISQREKDPKNQKILKHIAHDEKVHYQIWKKYTKIDIKPNKFRIWWYIFLSYVFGYTFSIKLLENGEDKSIEMYKSLDENIPELDKLIEDEETHEEALLNMLDEERLQYVGSIVLGLNDALVELTGTIAGLTFALMDNRVVALAAIITGIAATLSMAASNFLAERADGNPDALKSSVYTGVAYLITVVLMVLPYLLFPVHMYIASFVSMILVVILIIFFFNYYISVAKSQPFWRPFGEMAAISLGVAFISFLIGLLAKKFLGVDI